MFGESKLICKGVVLLNDFAWMVTYIGSYIKSFGKTLCLLYYFIYLYICIYSLTDISTDSWYEPYICIVTYVIGLGCDSWFSWLAGWLNGWLEKEEKRGRP